MSKGGLILVGYLSSSLGARYRLRIQPETGSLQIGSTYNGSAGPPNRILEFRAGGDRYRLGLHCRMVNFKFLGSPLPSGYKEGSTLSLPWLKDNDAYRRLARGQEGRYRGFPIIFTGSLPELVR